MIMEIIDDKTTFTFTGKAITKYGISKYSRIYFYLIETKSKLNNKNKISFCWAH